MKIWEFSISEIDLTSFKIPEAAKRDKFIEFVEIMGDTTQKFLNKWEPIVLLKDEQRIDADFIDLYDLGCIIVSSKVKKIIDSSMDDNDYEMLPFICEEEDYYLFNCLKTIDCIIKEKSIYEGLDNGLIADYEILMFDIDKLNGISVFKVPELPYKIFITDLFKLLYDGFELKGIDFDEENLVYIE